jgi:isopenicillin N synthase-like dioxygenase
MMNRHSTESQPVLPIIDLSRFTDEDPISRLETGKQLVKVCHEVGFCYLSNHGIPQSHIDEAFSWNTRFHDLPHEAKEAARRPEGSSTFLGWHETGKITVREGQGRPDATARHETPSMCPYFAP